MSFTPPSKVTRMFWGEMSRWTMLYGSPFESRSEWAKSSPAAASEMTLQMSGTRRGIPRCSQVFQSRRRSSPRRYSIDM